MKKFFTLIFVVLLTSQVFAQTEVEKKPSFIKDVRVGVNAGFEPALGDLSEFVFSTIGGGASVEVGIPLFPKINNFLLNNFGVSFRTAFNGAIMKDTNIASLFNMRFILGVYTRIPLGNVVTLVPEIGYGIAVNFPGLKNKDAGIVQPCYADQVIQVGVGVRFAHEKLLNGNLEFEITPTYTLCPETNNAAHYLGARIGALYRFNIGSSKIASEKKIKEANAKEAAVNSKSENSASNKTLAEKKERLKELIAAFEKMAFEAASNSLPSLQRKYKGYAEEVQKLAQSLDKNESEINIQDADTKLARFEKLEHDSEVELDMKVTEVAVKTGHAAVIHNPDGTITIAIPTLTFKPNTTDLLENESNTHALDTLVEVLNTHPDLADLRVSVVGFVNPVSRSEVWDDEEKQIAKGRGEIVKNYLLTHGVKQRIDARAGSGYTTNKEFNRRVEVSVHK